MEDWPALFWSVLFTFAGSCKCDSSKQPRERSSATSEIVQDAYSKRKNKQQKKKTQQNQIKQQFFLSAVFKTKYGRELHLRMIETSFSLDEYKKYIPRNKNVSKNGHTDVGRLLSVEWSDSSEFKQIVFLEFGDLYYKLK